MLRIIAGKMNAWNGAIDRQYILPDKPVGE